MVNIKEESFAVVSGHFQDTEYSFIFPDFFFPGCFEKNFLMVSFSPEYSVLGVHPASSVMILGYTTGIGLIWKARQKAIPYTMP